ncbi:hypothetical protein [Nocardia fluminea]
MSTLQVTAERLVVVPHPNAERQSPILGGRAIGKIVSAAYLLRDGGTEYE